MTAVPNCNILGARLQCCKEDSLGAGRETLRFLCNSGFRLGMLEAKHLFLRKFRLHEPDPRTQAPTTATPTPSAASDLARALHVAQAACVGGGVIADAMETEGHARARAVILEACCAVTDRMPGCPTAPPSPIPTWMSHSRRRSASPDAERIPHESQRIAVPAPHLRAEHS